MRTSETINELAAALAAAQGEMQNAAMSAENPHFKSRYADLAAIRNATIPALSKNGLVDPAGDVDQLHGDAADHPSDALIRPMDRKRVSHHLQ